MTPTTDPNYALSLPLDPFLFMKHVSVEITFTAMWANNDGDILNDQQIPPPSVGP